MIDRNLLFPWRGEFPLRLMNGPSWSYRNYISGRAPLSISAKTAAADHIRTN